MSGYLFYLFTRRVATEMLVFVSSPCIIVFYWAALWHKIRHTAVIYLLRIRSNIMLSDGHCDTTIATLYFNFDFNILQRIFLVRTKNIFVSPPLPGPTLYPRMRSGGEIASWVVLNEYDFYLNVYNQVGQKLWIPFLWLSSWLNLINFGWKDFHWK